MRGAQVDAGRHEVTVGIAKVDTADVKKERKEVRPASLPLRSVEALGAAEEVLLRLKRRHCHKCSMLKSLEESPIFALYAREARTSGMSVILKVWN